MFELYAAQAIPWKKRTDIKDNGAAVLAPMKPIKGRFEYKRRLIRDAKGEQIVSEAFVMTMTDVQPGDVIVWDGRDWPVVSVTTAVGLHGTVLHREVSL